jgi:hypothetical protein
MAGRPEWSCKFSDVMVRFGEPTAASYERRQIICETEA